MSFSLPSWRVCAAITGALILVAGMSYAQRPSPAAKIETRPDPPKMSGTWKVGDMEVSVTSLTQFDESEAALSAGACAEVSYVTTQAGVRVATKITGRGAGSC